MKTFNKIFFWLVKGIPEKYRPKTSQMKVKAETTSIPHITSPINFIKGSKRSSDSFTLPINFEVAEWDHEISETNWKSNRIDVMVIDEMIYQYDAAQTDDGYEAQPQVTSGADKDDEGDDHR